MQISLLGGGLVSALSISIGENGSFPLMTLTPDHNHVNAAPKQASLQTTSRPHHRATPKQNYCIYCTVNVLVSLPIREIKIKRVALATKYLILAQFWQFCWQNAPKNYLFLCLVRYHNKTLLVSKKNFVKFLQNLIFFSEKILVLVCFI